MLYFLQIYDANNGTIVRCLPFSWIKNYWKEKYFLFQEIYSKEVIPVNFLPQNFTDKIWHFFNIFHSFCVSETFDMSLVQFDNIMDVEEGRVPILAIIHTNGMNYSIGLVLGSPSIENTEIRSNYLDTLINVYVVLSPYPELFWK